MRKIHLFILVFISYNIVYSQKNTSIDFFADTVLIDDSSALIGNIISQGTCDDTLLLAMQLKDNTFFIVLNSDIYNNDIDSIFLDVASNTNFACMHIDYPCADLFVNKKNDSILFPHHCRADYELSQVSVASFSYPYNQYPILQEKISFFYRYSYPLIEYNSHDTICIEFVFSNIKNNHRITLGDITNSWMFMFKNKLNFFFQYVDCIVRGRRIYISNEL
jgi:hypothetical protein